MKRDDLSSYLRHLDIEKCDTYHVIFNLTKIKFKGLMKLMKLLVFFPTRCNSCKIHL